MIVTEVVHHLELAPLLWLGGLRFRGHARGVEWWWLAIALCVSWLANTIAHWVDPVLVGNLYPITQVVLIGAVFLERREARMLLAVLAIAGLVPLWWKAPGVADVFLPTIANLTAAGIVYGRRGLGRLRIALLVFFGLGGVFWFTLSARTVYCSGVRSCLVSSTSWGFWLAYHGALVAGMAIFCWAALNVTPRFQLSTKARR